MNRARPIVLILAVASNLLSASSWSGAGVRVFAQTEKTPTSYVCPMDADIVDDHPGACPVCQMRLQPVRIETAWSCPVHAVVMEHRAGSCPLDGRELVQVTINHFWTCAGDDHQSYAAAGKCSDGRPREERKEVRAHGDHNPRHGGQLFMAADRWHHVEGVYSAAGVFTLYVYDNFTKPVDPTAIAAHVISGDRAPVALSIAKDRASLETRIASARFPETITAKVQFTPKAPAQQFDFVFNAASVPPAVVSTAPAMTARVPPQPAPRTLPTPAAAPTRNAPVLASSLEGPGVAGADHELLTLLDVRTREIRTLIDQGAFTVVYMPAMLAKDAALSLEERAASWPSPAKNRMVVAVKRIVLAAWDIDATGDLGNRNELVRAYGEFAAAVSEVKAAYAAH